LFAAIACGELLIGSYARAARRDHAFRRQARQLVITARNLDITAEHSG
jgi:hypothetical protein